MLFAQFRSNQEQTSLKLLKFILAQIKLPLKNLLKPFVRHCCFKGKYGHTNPWKQQLLTSTHIWIHSPRVMLKSNLNISRTTFLVKKTTHASFLRDEEQYCNSYFKWVKLLVLLMSSSEVGQCLRIYSRVTSSKS